MIAAETVLIGFRGMSRAAAIREIFPSGVPYDMTVITVEGALSDDPADYRVPFVVAHRCETVTE